MNFSRHGLATNRTGHMNQSLVLEMALLKNKILPIKPDGSFLFLETHWFHLHFFPLLLLAVPALKAIECQGCPGSVWPSPQPPSSSAWLCILPRRDDAQMCNLSSNLPSKFQTSVSNVFVWHLHEDDSKALTTQLIMPETREFYSWHFFHFYSPLPES